MGLTPQQLNFQESIRVLNLGGVPPPELRKYLGRVWDFSGNSCGSTPEIKCFPGKLDSYVVLLKENKALVIVLLTIVISRFVLLQMFLPCEVVSNLSNTCCDV